MYWKKLFPWFVEYLLQILCKFLYNFMNDNKVIQKLIKKITVIVFMICWILHTNFIRGTQKKCTKTEEEGETWKESRGEEQNFNRWGNLEATGWFRETRGWGSRTSKVNESFLLPFTMKVNCEKCVLKC